MAYMPLNFSPFDYQRATAPLYENDYGYRINNQYVPNLNQWNQEQNQAQQNAFQGYADDQFKNLFDMVNRANAKTDPLKSLSAAPRYNPYEGTREQFTTPATTRYDWDADTTYPVASVFDQKGYLDARFGNINNYLSNLGSFFGNLGISGASDEGVKQRAAQQAEYASSLPQVGSSGNMGGVPQTGGLSGFAQATPGSNYGGWGGGQVSGGWGSHPVVGGLLG